MKDMRGNELNVGDFIYYYRHNMRGSEMIKTKIIGFTDNMVKIRPFSKFNTNGYTCVSPNDCVYIGGY